ncbi:MULTISPECIES: septum formation inhibitor Maf [Winogradskyella]|uniref:septum formation inhibitor Maf n=1 Tax=Winogradskyella TaxID=286104 RepID=UPI0015CB1CBF|nr:MULTISPECIES: septum formation inhibitor Maf [Winogradskyella]QXP78900.1 septum formation inhibitor Maf [Winogradskyella sp. HaHa_3_26]
MIKITKNKAPYVLLIGTFLSLTSCNENKTTTSESIAITEAKTEILKPKAKLSKDFKDYWYNGDAEITSYKLEQARYGEIREGSAILVFVTEDFLPEKQVKADNYSENNIPVLKVNATKNFNTGIYPYSIMQSTFYPVVDNQHAIKITTSVQEWCGQTYMQLNNRDNFEIQSHSYFQNQADQSFKIEKALTENELWAKLRINPKSLPVGQIDIIPAMEYIRLNNIAFKPHKALASLKNDSYTISYDELGRTLKINFNQNFPYEIEGWEETTIHGLGANAKSQTTKASKLKTIKSDYWNKKSNTDSNLREILKLQ